MQAAQRKVERLREQVASTPIALAKRGKKIQMTTSAGLASFPQDGEDAAELLALADERMQAKREERNRVVASAEVVPT